METPLTPRQSFTEPDRAKLSLDPDFAQTLAIAAKSLNITYEVALARFSESFAPDAELDAAITAAEQERYPMLSITN